MRVKSIRARLLLYIAVTQIIVAVTGTWFVILHTRRASYAAFNADLAERAGSLVPLVEDDESSGTLILHQELSTVPRGDYYRVTDSEGHLISEITGLPEEAIAAKGREFVDLLFSGARYRVLTLRDLNLPSGEGEGEARPKTINIVYAAPLAGVEHHLHRIAFSAASTFLALFVFSLGACLWSIHYGLQPLTRLATEASKIDANRWTFQPSADVRHVQELAPLTESLALLVNRLKLAFGRERQLFGDAAHELKTAIAILKSTLQSSLHCEESAPQYRTGLTRAIEDTGRLETLVFKMLHLASIEQASPSNHSQSQLSSDFLVETQTVIEQLQSIAAVGQVTLYLRPRMKSDVAIEAEDLRLVMTNILENAIQHSPQQSCVVITLSADETSGKATVRDYGPGIPAETMPHIFDRFYRGDTSRARATGGFGLGLSIAQAVARRAGGDITAASFAEGGSIFTVRIPKPVNKPP